MPLRIGVAAFAVAVAIAAGVAIGIVFLSEPEVRAAAKPEPLAETTAAPRAPLVLGERQEKPREREPEPTVAKAAPEVEEGPQKNDTPREPRQEPRQEPRPSPEPREEDPRPEPREEALPVSEQGWELPDQQEIARADEPRYYDPGPGAALALTVPALGVYDAPIFDSDSPRALNAGVVHVPETSMPWDRGAQRNVYLASHRLGYEGTGSRLLFYELDELKKGDEVVLKGKGKTYRYRVSETFVVGPYDSWVMGQVRGRDMVTLQTCTPIPTFEKRLIVRADRV